MIKYVVIDKETGKDTSTCKVYKIKDTKYKIYGNCGQYLIEDKPTYKEQFKAKEQECEELKKSILRKCPNCGEEYLNYKGVELYDRNYDLKQALTDIKEIAEAESYLSPQSTRLLVHKILQKISEVENDK